jgi:hypothetical protein
LLVLRALVHEHFKMADSKAIPARKAIAGLTVPRLVMHR